MTKITCIKVFAYKNTEMYVSNLIAANKLTAVNASTATQKPTMLIQPVFHLYKRNPFLKFFPLFHVNIYIYIYMVKCVSFSLNAQISWEPFDRLKSNLDTYSLETNETKELQNFSRQRGSESHKLNQNFQIMIILFKKTYALCCHSD